MNSDQIVTTVLVCLTLLPIVIPWIRLLAFYIFPPKKFTIQSTKTGKVVSFNMRGENDPRELIEFGKVFCGLE